MSDLDDIIQNNNITSYRSTDIEDFSITSKRNPIPTFVDDLNDDEPKPQIEPSIKLQNLLATIDNTKARAKLPMQSVRNIQSVRVIHEPEESNVIVHNRSARDYQPTLYPMTRKQSMDNMTKADKAYIWRMKFQRLNSQNGKISIPDSNDPDVLEKLYYEALRTNHYSSSSSTWLIYMTFGYIGFQMVLRKIGINLPPEFVEIQVEALSSYTTLLASLGEPGGPSIGSNWSPWVKLLVVVCMHSLIFMLIHWITGSTSSARNTQQFICRTGFMGGSQINEGAADNATHTVGSMIGNMFGGNGGGIGSIISNVMNMFTGQSSVSAIDPNNPPRPISERPANNQQFNSNRATPFD